MRVLPGGRAASTCAGADAERRVGLDPGAFVPRTSRNVKSCEPEGPQDLTSRPSHVRRRPVNWTAESSELAESEADCHLAAALAWAGCPLELLRQIVLSDSTGRVHGCEACGDVMKGGPHVRGLHAWLDELAKRGRDAPATTLLATPRRRSPQAFLNPTERALL
jgi:hypothetical protein